MESLRDLPAYLMRIGLPASQPPPTVDSLFALHRAHAESIPFENLDVLLGRPIRLDLPSLESKLVAARRGGYCFDEGSERVLQSLGPTGWGDLYAFTLEPQLPVDFLVANHYTSTHPDSTFTKMAIAQRTSDDVAFMVRGDVFSILRPGAEPEEQPIADDEELLVLLKERFDLTFPAGTKFRPRVP